MSDRSFVLRGDICHTPDPKRMQEHKDAFVVCEDGICRGIYERIPEKYANLPVTDCSGRLIIPGLVDLHIHAPQFAFRGTGLDYELLEWLERQAFPEEMRYADGAYARRAYTIFAQKLKKSAATRVVMFATIHREATLTLMDCMEETGLISFVGKVNMDRESPPSLTEADAARAAEETRRFIKEAGERAYKRTRPIITPRFIPSCSEELLEELGKIRAEYNLPVQSHLSENPGEVELVKKLVPEAAFYGDAYDRHGLFGGEGRTIMAHCIYSTPEETQLMKRRGVWIAHCPESNMNLSSGIAPVRKYLDGGLKVGLGTDIGAGTSESLFRAAGQAVQVSKMYRRYLDESSPALTFSESFFMASKGGGSFFGKVGSFEEGYEFDALVLDDSSESTPAPPTVRERAERAFYLGLDRGGIAMKFAAGERIMLDNGNNFRYRA